MIGKILLISCYILSYFLVLLRFRGVYIKETSDSEFVRKKLSIGWLLIMLLVSAIPVFNIIGMIAYWIFLIKFLEGDYWRRYEIRSFFLKKI